MITIPTNEVYAMPAITQQLLDDNAFDLENWLITELGDAFGDAEADAFINGNGVTQPRGLFTYDVVTTADATRAHDKFQYVPTGASGDFAASNPGDALISACVRGEASVPGQCVLADFERGSGEGSQDEGRHRRLLPVATLDAGGPALDAAGLPGIRG
jgi:hypothetical protein